MFIGKRKKIIIIIGIFIVCLLWYIIWIDRYNNNSKIQKTIQQEVLSEGITIKESVSGVNSGGNIDIWSIGIDDSGEKINIFSRIRKNKIINLVLENTKFYNKKGIQDLLELKGNYKIIKGSGYERTANIVKGP